MEMRRRVFGIALVAAVAAIACSAQYSEEDALDENGEGLSAPKSYTPGCKPLGGPSYALHGMLLLPGGAQDGYVVVKDERISLVTPLRTAVPAGVTVVETGGVISPGLIDLHNHVAYNFIPFWDSGKRWQNRYQWAKASAYTTAVKNPYNAVKGANNLCEAVKYGEYRALVGGTTTIQGSADLTCTRSWVRNVEYTNFCSDHIRQDVLPISALTQTDADSLNAQFASGQTKAFFVHLAEGVDDSSRAEFDKLRSLGLLKPQVVGIHSTALTPAQLTEMGQAGMKIVWSPLSNLALYGQTTDIPHALAAGIKISIAPDWSPSGSANVLGELKVADRVNREKFGGLISDADLWRMTTENPALIAGMDDKLGKLQAGYFADLMVVRGDVTHPYRAVIDAKPADVLLTAVSGQAFYGDPSIVASIGDPRSYVTVDACGEARSLAATETQLALPLGTETLTDVTATFTKDGVTSIIPLYQCQGAPESAFH